MFKLDPGDICDLASPAALHGAPDQIADMLDSVIGIAIVVYEMHPPRP